MTQKEFIEIAEAANAIAKVSGYKRQAVSVLIEEVKRLHENGVERYNLPRYTFEYCF